MQIAFKLRAHGFLVGESSPPLRNKKEKERSKGHCLPHICQDKQKRIGGWWPVNLWTNEWALLKICHPLALHVVNIQPKPHRGLLFLLLSLPERERKSKTTSYLLLSSLNCPAIELYSWLLDKRKVCVKEPNELTASSCVQTAILVTSYGDTSVTVTEAIFLH